MNVVFHTRGSIDKPQREAIKQLEAIDGLRLTVMLESQSGRQADSLIGEIVRLWQQFGAYSIVFIGQRLLARLQTDEQSVAESTTLESEIITVDDVHSQSSVEQLQNIDPDLGIVYGHKILKPCVFTIPNFDTIGIHWGTVPEYRGKWCIFWEMYNGENSTAITFQVINKGIDTGQIIKQVPVEISASDTLTAVKKRVSETTAKELPKVVERYRETNGDIKTNKQDSGGSLYTNPKLRHKIIFRVRRGFQRLLE